MLTDLCEFCGHPLLIHDPITGFCLEEDCDCIDCEDVTEFSPFLGLFPER